MQIDDELLDNSLCKNCVFLVQRVLSSEGVEPAPGENLDDDPFIIQALCRVIQDEIFLRVLECTAFVEKKSDFFKHDDIWC